MEDSGIVQGEVVVDVVVIKKAFIRVTVVRMLHAHYAQSSLSYIRCHSALKKFQCISLLHLKLGKMY